MMMNNPGRGARRALSASIMMFAAWGCAEDIHDAPVYHISQCARAALIDAENGRRIVGAEDFAIDRDRRILYVSAYDRRAVERAVRNRAFMLPEGGVYRVSVDDLAPADGRLVAATPIVDRDSIPGGLRPHGVDYDHATGEISFVNRSYQKIHGRWRMTPRIERAGANGETVMAATRRAPCAANDLVARSGAEFVSMDHAACGWRGAAEDLFGLARSGVVAANGEPAFAGARFANGVALTSAGDLVVAGTRDNALHLLPDADAEAPETIELPGGPDNLTIADDGSLIAAVHPSLILLALDRKLKIGRAGSRIVKVNPESGAVSTLYDDPDGVVYSAATVGAEIGGLLIAGSVTDSGLLVCRKTERRVAQIDAVAQ